MEQKIYSPNNAAKQWILDQIKGSFGERAITIVDFGCGYGSVWPAFLPENPQYQYKGFDFNRSEIEKAKQAFVNLPNAQVALADAQKQLVLPGSADVITAFSALEHIVDLKAFVSAVLTALRPGGRAYLNYDAGHFRSHDLKERLMVPISQWLAKVGIEGPYMKEVDDDRLCEIVQQLGGKVITVRKHNCQALKGFLKKHSTNQAAVNAWFGFEEAISSALSPKDLHKLFLSTTVVIEKV